MERKHNYKRALAALTHWKAFQAKPHLHPYFHPPDLFAIDPCVVKPHYVPGTFIPIYIGGNIEIHDISGGRVKSEGSETKEFILANFLPGGYKKRWGFHHYRAVWVPSKRHPECADIRSTFRFEKSTPLSSIYPDSETFSPLNIPVHKAMIYFPDQVKVEKVPGYAHYYWNEEQNLLNHNHTGNTIEVVRDPISTPLFSGIKIRGEITETVIEYPEEGLIQTIGYLDPFILARCYYANSIQLFGKATTTLTRLIRFYNDKDDTYALIGTEHLSQATWIEFSLKKLFERITDTLQEDNILKNDLRMQYVLNQLYESVLYQQIPLESTYDIDGLFQLLVAMDYWLHQTGQGENLKELFDQESPDIESILQELIPDSKDTRLRLAGYDSSRREALIHLITKNHILFRDIFNHAFDPKELESFCRQVIYITMEKVVTVWVQHLFGSAGDGLTYWHESDRDVMTFYAYDRYQGGAGIAKELFRKFQGISPELLDIKKALEQSLLCDVDITESIIHDLFLTYDPEFLVSGFRRSDSSQDAILRLTMEKIERKYGLHFNAKKREDLIAFCKIDVSRLVSSEDIAAFYMELIQGYTDIRKLLHRTPTTVDLLLYCSGDMFYDPRATAVFERYRNRKKGDLSELIARIEEMMPSCTSGCPECIEIASAYGHNIIESNLLNKGLLTKLLEIR